MSHSDQHQEELHVVFGAGQVGTLVAGELLARGYRVRQVRRGAPNRSHPQLEWRSGDIADLAFVEEASRGAAVVYQCTNAPYPQWPEQLPVLYRHLARGAQTAGARFVVLDCLYMYGRPSGPIDEDTPVAPCSRKGELRARLADELLAASARGDLQLTIGRASDYFGPNAGNAWLGERFFQRAFAGRRPEVPGDPDMPHAYTYIPDVARGLVRLATDARALGKVWMLPTPPAESTRALVDRLGRALGRDIALKRISELEFRVAGLFSPMLREAREMDYQWKLPYAVNDARFRATFGEGATPIEKAVAETAAWARATFGADQPHRGALAAR